MSESAWVVIGIALWLGVCIIVNAVMEHSKRERKLKEDLDKTRARCKRLEREMKALRKQIAPEKQHAIVIRDEENDRLRKELFELEALHREQRQVWEKKYKTLEKAMNQMWPKGHKETR